MLLAHFNERKSATVQHSSKSFSQFSIPYIEPITRLWDLYSAPGLGEDHFIHSPVFGLGANMHLPPIAPLLFSLINVRNLYYKRLLYVFFIDYRKFSLAKHDVYPLFVFYHDRIHSRLGAEFF